MNEWKQKIWTHMGHSTFERSCYREIQNCDFVKPKGGLWASEEDAAYGWRDWCYDNDIHWKDWSKRFSFRLADTAKVLDIHTVGDLDGLPTLNSLHSIVCLDFEEIQKQGYDAVWYTMTTDHELYWKLYGWDCASLLLMNPDVMELV